MTLLYSSTAPAGWNALPTPVKEKFYAIAAKGDWTATEAYDHLVPDTLKDNPAEVEMWMDGGEVTTQEWVYDRGRGGGHYEEVTHTVPDRDVSRIEAGANGGEYSADNTIMEDMSVNRSRGGVDMTEQELASTVEVNAADVEVIETLPGDIPTDIPIDIDSAPLPDSFLGEVFSFVLPVVGAIKGAQLASNLGESQTERLAWQASGGVLGAAVMMSPAGPYIAAGAFIISCHKFVYKKLSTM